MSWICRDVLRASWSHLELRAEEMRQGPRSVFTHLTERHTVMLNAPTKSRNARDEMKSTREENNKSGTY